MDQKCPKIYVVWVIIYPEENEWYGNEMKEKIYVINIDEKLYIALCLKDIKMTAAVLLLFYWKNH